VQVFEFVASASVTKMVLKLQKNEIKNISNFKQPSDVYSGNHNTQQTKGNPPKKERNKKKTITEREKTES
jgi:hypothetical protein